MRRSPVNILRGSLSFAIPQKRLCRVCQESNPPSDVPALRRRQVKSTSDIVETLATGVSCFSARPLATTALYLGDLWNLARCSRVRCALGRPRRQISPLRRSDEWPCNVEALKAIGFSHKNVRSFSRNGHFHPFTAATSSSRGKISGRGPTGVIANGLICA